MTITEFCTKYDHLLSKAKFNFVEYYKFTFTFDAEVDGTVIRVMCGGGAEDIYRFDVSANENQSLKDLDLAPYYYSIVNGTEVIDEAFDE